jgi:hypothetical protein
MNDEESKWESSTRPHSKVLFLHGLNSRPYEDRIEILKASGAEVFCPHIDYNKDDEITIAIDIIEKKGITHLVGHSLGGILAYYLSNKFKLPALMFNPAFGEGNIKYFEEIDMVKNLPIYKEQFAVVGMQDDVVNPFLQLAHLKHATVWKVGDLGHKIDPATYKKYFEIFCEKTNIIMDYIKTFHLFEDENSNPEKPEPVKDLKSLKKMMRKASTTRGVMYGEFGTSNQNGKFSFNMDNTDKWEQEGQMNYNGSGPPKMYIDNVNKRFLNSLGWEMIDKGARNVQVIKLEKNG